MYNKAFWTEVIMALYIVKHNGGVYANMELYSKAISGGEQNFLKSVTKKEVTSITLFDQLLFRISDAQYKTITESYAPQEQDFDAQYKRLNLLSHDAISDKENLEETYPGVTVVKAAQELTENTFSYGKVDFFKLLHFNPSRGDRYRMLPNMAKIRVCKYWYIALNAVNIVSDKPIIVTS